MLGSASRRLLLIALGTSALLAACGSSSSTSAAENTTATTAGSTTSASAAPTTTTGQTTTTPLVRIATDKLGLALVDPEGHTLYILKSDPAGKSTCTGACATLWPPLTTTSPTITLGKGLTASFFSTVTSGGTKIVAIQGHPLYRFSGDKAAGQTNGEGIGGVWHVAGPIGNAM